MSSLSFKEKSIWGSLVALAAVSGWYFWTAFDMAAAGINDLSALGNLAVGLVVLLVIVDIVLHSIIAGRNGEEPEDERDRLIALKGERVASYVLGFSVFAVIGHLWFSEIFGGGSVSAFVTGNLLLLALTLSEIAKCASQLIYYRWGA